MPSAYKPSDAEPRITRAWDEAKPFHADPARVLRGEAEPYCIFIPPPNVTAALHLGHALNNTLQDILARAHRMMGFETLWMPGTDHAGIATQAVVEKRVWQEEKKRRHDFTREEFIAKIQAFKDEYEKTITDQLKVMGCSCDWDRQRFTMDEQCAAAVREAFFRLFRDGLIYRGKRLVNWDPELKTAVADDETDEIEIETAFYYMRYPLVHLGGTPLRGVSAAEQRDVRPVTWGELARRGYAEADQHPADQQAWVTVATTRPETYLGDAAIGMNPHDPRLKALDGLWVQLPLVGRILPIVADEYVVLPKALGGTALQSGAEPLDKGQETKAEYATGFLKVTPAHDQNDYDLYFRRKEQIDRNSTGTGLISVMAPDASISDKHGWTDIGDAGVFLGLSREDARKKVVAEFKARGLLEGTKPYRQTVKISDRSKAIIEPYLSDQWFVKVTDPRMAQTANAALVPEQRSHPLPEGGGRGEGAAFDGSMSFHPARYAKTFEHWHDNIRDWCISRQLWWGHRIPVWMREYSIIGASPALALPIGIVHSIEGDWSLSGCIHLTERLSEDRFREMVCPITPARSSERRLTCPFPVIQFNPSRSHAFIAKSEAALFAELEREGFVQDPDVLDTWFSSALWPLSTLGWPDPAAYNAESNKGLLEAFNPSSVLCTAREIITLWVSRMVMFNRYLLGDGASQRESPNQDPALRAGPPGPVPFKNVFIHAVIQDGDGRKMSKSLGNGVDPRDIIESHGADAMRFTLAQMATNTQDVRLPVLKDPKSGKNTSPKFDAGRNFCNKLWNASRFALTILRRPLRDSATSTGPARSAGPPDALIDRWMLSRLHAGVKDVEAALANYEFANYAQNLYDLLWRDFCDWYIEGIKPTVDSSRRQRAVLAHALETIVRLLHPVTPFVTEAIWEHLRHIETDVIEGIDLGASRKGGLLCTAGWPKIADSLRDDAAEREFERLRSLITSIREVRSQHNVHDRRKITLHAPGNSAAVLSIINAPNASGLVPTLAGLGAVTDAAPSAGGGAHVAFRFEGHELYLSNLADAVDASTEKARLEKLVADLRKTIATLSGRLSNAGYMSKAPAKLVEETRSQLEKAQDELRAALEHLERVT
ncbi:MAG: valine--tRNA ligase [Phycisphaeraceae bacterium]|nr:valine--tRNA ligase [Phycisphaeraceae bacterium]